MDCDEGAFHKIATVMDLSSHRVVGWALSDQMRTEFVEDALAMAFAQRRPAANPRYTGRQVWNRQRTDLDLADPANTGLGHK